MTRTDELLQFIDEHVTADDRVTLKTPSKTVRGPVTRLDPLTLDPTSGVVIEYQVSSDGLVFETRWDDTAAEESAVTETRLGMLQDVSIEDSP